MGANHATFVFSLIRFSFSSFVIIPSMVNYSEYYKKPLPAQMG
jgi:hypothetical protein